VIQDDWNRILDQLGNDDCTPFLGAGVCGASLPPSRELSRRLAEKYRYPFPDAGDLIQVTQYLAIMRFSNDAIYTKKVVCQELATMAGEPPDFSDPLEPHAALAELPISIFLTTNYDDFLVQALRHAGKDPQIALYPWNSSIRSDNGPFARSSGWNPRPEKPLVYHLHGTLAEPASIVVTEDDYLEFGASLIRHRTWLPPSIQKALTTKSLLFLGYRLRDSTFRLMFRQLLSAVPEINRRTHLSVQLQPSDDDVAAELEELTIRYLTQFYHQWRIDIYWGRLNDFMQELRRQMG